MALIMALGKPSICKTFGDLALEFIKLLKTFLTPPSRRIDVVFDRYFKHSIKASTRQRRSKLTKGIGAKITDATTLLPKDWKTFMCLDQNKVNLVEFLAEQIMQEEVDEDIDIIMSGGFQEEAQSIRGTPVNGLSSTQEEADTRMLLHAKHASEDSYSRIIINSRDMNVLLLLLYHMDNLSTEVWMQFGTPNKPKYIAVHNIHLPQSVRMSILAFHAITESDSTSPFIGISKAAAWKLSKLGTSLIPDANTLADTEEFVCRLYDPDSDMKSIQDLRSSLFCKLTFNVKKIPPTTDALKLHILRAHYQARVWLTALTAKPNLPQVTSCE